MIIDKETFGNLNINKFIGYNHKLEFGDYIL